MKNNKTNPRRHSVKKNYADSSLFEPVEVGATLTFQESSLRIEFDRIVSPNKDDSGELSLRKIRVYRYSSILSMFFTENTGMTRLQVNNNFFSFYMPEQEFMEVKWTSEELFNILSSIIMDNNAGNFVDKSFKIRLVNQKHPSNAK